VAAGGDVAARVLFEHLLVLLGRRLVVKLGVVGLGEAENRFRAAGIQIRPAGDVLREVGNGQVVPATEV
jgi:hypothetical protein